MVSRSYQQGPKSTEKQQTYSSHLLFTKLMMSSTPLSVILKQTLSKPTGHGNASGNSSNVQVNSSIGLFSSQTIIQQPPPKNSYLVTGVVIGAAAACAAGALFAVNMQSDKSHTLDVAAPWDSRESERESRPWER